MTRFKSDDVNLLLPSFALHVMDVVADLQDAGHKPVVFDTLRTPEEAAKFAKRGTGSKNSMHLYGVAADIICGDHGWDCAKHKCGFYDLLGKVAEERGLVWGGRWKRVDKPHIQYCLVAEQAVVRAINSPVDRDEFCRLRYEARTKPPSP